MESRYIGSKVLKKG